MFNSRQFYNVNRASVLTPQIRAIWDNMCIGVAVVDAGFMNVDRISVFDSLPASTSPTSWRSSPP